MSAIASTSGAAGRYAQAVFELARDKKALDDVERDLGALSEAIDASPELARLVASPAFDRDQQAAAMTAIMEKMGAADLTRRFVGLMAAKGRLSALPGAVAGFRERLADHRGEIVAEVTSAAPLTDAQRDKLAANLRQSYGKDVRIDASVDESLLGGLVVKIGSKMIDSSLKARLAGLRRAMKSA